jgi:hypothetical protein
MDTWIADKKNGRKERTACQEATETNPEKTEPNPGEKEAFVERQETPNEEAAIHSLRTCRKEWTACQETTEARLESEEPTSVDMESEAVHEEFRMEEAAVKSSGTMKKRHRDRHLASERRGEPKELTRGICESRRKLAATCRKVSLRAAVAQHKKNVFRKILTQGNCGPRKKLAVAGRKTTRCAKVAQCKGYRRKRQDKDLIAPRGPKGRTVGKRRWKGPECNNGIRDQA